MVKRYMVNAEYVLEWIIPWLFIREEGDIRGLGLFITLVPKVYY